MKLDKIKLEKKIRSDKIEIFKEMKGKQFMMRMS